MSAVIETEQLGRRYGNRWALVRVDLQVQAGERVLVAGANGGGKSTLLKLLSTILPPSVGRLRLFGMDPAKDLMKVRARLALLGHQPAVYEDLSGPENLEVVMRLSGKEGPVEPLLERVGLPVRTDPVSGYSAGMRKRLSFARLLAQQPELALVDEPYGALDPSGFAFVDGLLGELAAQGCAVVVASHQVERIGRFCDRAILVDQGQVRWTGPAPDAHRAWTMLHGTRASADA